jgi:hypothetical protein
MWALNIFKNILMRKLQFQNSTIKSLMNQNEFHHFQNLVVDLCNLEKYKDITGVCLVGSFIQSLELPFVSCTSNQNSLEKIYRSIVKKDWRKVFPNTNSDLDIWICTRDIIDPEAIAKDLDNSSIELLKCLSRDSNLHGTSKWIKMKHIAFDKYYKQNYLYSQDWIKANGEIPWLADRFKKELIEKILKHLPILAQRVNTNFNKKIEDDFLEVRAFPSSVFNLRPEKLLLNGSTDRTPFAFYLKDWIDLSQNCFVMYKTNTSNIYPFGENGTIRGEAILKSLKSVHISSYSTNG